MPNRPDTSAAPRSFDLDRERVASMAYEGGAAAAEKEREEDLQWEQSQQGVSLTRWRTPRGWTKTVLVSALVVGAAAALLTRLALRWTRR